MDPTHSRPKLLAGNWKMNHPKSATKDFFSELHLLKKPHARARIYAPYLSLETALNVCASGNGQMIEIGAQNLHFEKSGAFTGEVSGVMLKEIGINQVLVGHSERRQYFNETNATVLKRTLSALEQGFEVLVCVGEILAEREANKTDEVLKEQLALILNHKACQESLGRSLHLAYEPVWAIGTGVVATPLQAESAHAFIRKLISAQVSEETANRTLILYGGSVTPGNFKELLQCPNIDGGLVGGASLKAESFKALWDLI